MKDGMIALLIFIPVLFFIAWWWGWSVCYRDAKVEDRREKAKVGSAGLGRGITLGQLSVKKKGGVR